jgi:nitrite reductase/ring-hydroxylating ferredoxin subunit
MTGNATWWAVARSEEVGCEKPINVDIGDQPVVLWRDAGGVVRALEDRCPHRRAPLSLGCILKTGMIQCGYHGWTYDGASGRLVDIPDVPQPASATLPLGGTVNVTIDHAAFINAMFDDPCLVLAIKGVRFSPYLMEELAVKDGRLTLERNCQWASPHWPAPFSSDFPISLRITTDPVTGESDLLLRDASFTPLLEATIAPVPAARGVTQVRWRAKLGSKRSGLMAKLMGIGTPFTVLSTVDGAALRVLKPSASIHAEDLRAQILKGPHDD